MNTDYKTATGRDLDILTATAMGVTLTFARNLPSFGKANEAQEYRIEYPSALLATGWRSATHLKQRETASTSVISCDEGSAWNNARYLCEIPRPCACESDLVDVLKWARNRWGTINIEMTAYVTVVHLYPHSDEVPASSHGVGIADSPDDIATALCRAICAAVEAENTQAPGEGGAA